MTMHDVDTLYALTSYYAERYSEPDITAIERDTVLTVFLACLCAFGMWQPSAQRLVWTESDPHERIRQMCQTESARILQ